MDFQLLYVAKYVATETTSCPCLVWNGRVSIMNFEATKNTKIDLQPNKAGYTATLVNCGWAGAMLQKLTRASGQEQYAQKAQKRRKSNSRKSVRWSAIPVPC